MDSRIENYKFIGKLALWKFPGNKNHPGWNIAMDENGKKSLIELLILMSSSEWPSRKLIALDDPLGLGQQWINTLGIKHVFNKVLFAYRPDEAELFYLDENDTNPKLYLGPSSINALINHLKKGSFDEDMSTPDGTNALYFW